VAPPSQLTDSLNQKERPCPPARVHHSERHAGPIFGLPTSKAVASSTATSSAGKPKSQAQSLAATSLAAAAVSAPCTPSWHPGRQCRRGVGSAAHESRGSSDVDVRRSGRNTSAVSDGRSLPAEELVMQQPAPCSLDLVSTLVASFGSVFDRLERHEQRQVASLGGGHADAAAEDVSGCLGNNLQGVSCVIDCTELCKLSSEMVVLCNQPGVLAWGDGSIRQRLPLSVQHSAAALSSSWRRTSCLIDQWQRWLEDKHESIPAPTPTRVPRVARWWNSQSRTSRLGR
jgi:hypothetical protein